MEKGAALHQVDVHPQLGSHQTRDVCRLDQVTQHVLPVAGAVAQSPDDLGELRVQVGDADISERVLSGTQADLLDFLLASLDLVLDALGVDPAVQDEGLEGHPGHLPSHRVEAREQHSLWGVVDDQVDPGNLLERSNVAALATDDPTLHLIAWQVQHRHHGL